MRAKFYSHAMVVKNCAKVEVIRRHLCGCEGAILMGKAKKMELNGGYLAHRQAVTSTQATEVQPLAVVRIPLLPSYQLPTCHSRS